MKKGSVFLIRTLYFTLSHKFPSTEKQFYNIIVNSITNRYIYKQLYIQSTIMNPLKSKIIFCIRLLTITGSLLFTILILRVLFNDSEMDTKMIFYLSGAVICYSVSMLLLEKSRKKSI